MDTLTEYFPPNTEKWDEKFHRLTCELFPDSDDYELMYSIQADEKAKIDFQSFNTAMIGIRGNIGDDLKSKFSYISVDDDYGDGDEGIIVVTKVKETS